MTCFSQQIKILLLYIENCLKFKVYFFKISHVPGLQGFKIFQFFVNSEKAELFCSIKLKIKGKKTQLIFVTALL